MTLNTLNRKYIVSQMIYTAMAMTGMILLPILVHLIPFSGVQPLGAYLLPMFIPPLVAAFYVSPVGLVLAALFAPIINHALTGMPQVPRLYFVVGELIVFSVLVYRTIQKGKTFSGFSAIAFLIAKLVVMVPMMLIINGKLSLSDVGHNLTGLMVSIPGLLFLFIVERLLLHQQK